MSLKKIRKTPLQRTAALLCAALAACGLAGQVSAQTGPLTTSPPQPTPYQWQNYHSGGAPIPTAQYPAPPTVADALGLTPYIDPLQGQLQGTPTEPYNGNFTQIPSFVLGNYLPTSPPSGTIVGGVVSTPYYPNHFADGSIFSWAAPFNYIPQTLGQVTVDDGPLPSTAPTYTNNIPTVSGFTATSNWTSVTAPGAATPGIDTSPAAENATNAEYLRLASSVAGSAVWTLVEPDAGNYSLYLHIPSDLPDSAGTAEVRDTQVVYEIQVLDAAGNVTTTTTATASQTEANDSQFLAGPFQIAAGGYVVVTLTRGGSPALNNNADYLVADSLTLQQTIGDVQSAPTVITRDSYPADFARAQYWGIYVPATVSANAPSTSPVPATAAAQNAVPDTNDGQETTTSTILLKTGSTTTAVGATPGVYDPTRLIRQLVYFGRSDPSATVTATLDDSNAGFTSQETPVPVTSATASNGEYLRYGTAAGPAPTAATQAAATWKITAPAVGTGTSLFVYAHIPATPTGETRLSRVYYTVTTDSGTYGPVAISQITQGTDALVALPTGAITATANTTITVNMYSVNTTGTTGTSFVVADSVNVSTGTGQGAIYCVDGFTGGVLWRFETPGSANGASAPVFASPAIARINVVITPPVYDTNGNVTTPAVYQNKLVAIVGDNNGLVYCLDAIGNGDGTSNAAVLNTTTLQPNIIPQPAYGTVVAPLAAGTAYAAAAAAAHVGTTGVYWIYRPDANSPKYVTGGSIGAVKPVDPTTDLPVPAAFSTVSPNIFVDPSVPTGVATTANPTPAAPTASNSIVYIGNSNGVLYALDGGGAPIDGALANTFTATGDTFNVSQIGTVFDVPTPNGNPGSPYPLTAVVPTAQPLWWFSLRGVDPNSAANTSSADIESAPAVYVHTLTTAVTVPPVGNSTATRTTTYQPTVYIGSAHEQEVTSNVGRLYALNGLYGPSGNNGQLNPVFGTANYTPPGGFNYNVGQRPAISGTDTSDWTFPDAYGTYKIGSATVTGQSYNSSAGGADGGPRPALGNITGSPVVFTNIDETATHLNPDNSPRQTRIYIAANSGPESTTATPVPVGPPDATTTGRIWAVNLDGSVGTTTNSQSPEKSANNPVWAYPLANDPNDAAKTDVPEPDSPMGSFLRATPAIGFVQFPATIYNGDASTYNPTDKFHATGIDSQSVPMLYLGTQGVNDTALYAVDIDGDMTSDSEGTATGTDTRTIYRVVSPDGSIFQSSVALITNATSAQGNGGAIYAVAGDTLYDYSATPITNPFAGEAYPLIREDRAYVGFGPISSPAIAGADVADLFTAATPFGLYNGADTTDWVIVGDSSSGLCRAITPQDQSYGGIPPALGLIVPPSVNPPSAALLNALMQTFLVPSLTNISSTQALPVGATAPLQVYDWGESVYACFTNVAPPNPVNPSTGLQDPAKFVYDHTQYPNGPVAGMTPFYSSDGSAAQTVTFNLSDADTTTTSPLLLDNGSISQTVLSTATLNAATTATSPALNGYIVDTGSLSLASATPPFPQAVVNVVQNLQTSANTRYLGLYTYTIADGTARNNTPGARRRFLNVKQTVNVYSFDGTNYAPNGTAVITGDSTGNNLVTVAVGQPFEKVPAIDQPTFGILNPLAVRGGGVPLIPALPPGTSAPAVPVGDELGPFRGVNTDPNNGGLALPTQTNPNSGDKFALQALTNGNDVLTYAPSSTTGVGASPIARPVGSNDLAGVNAPTNTAVVVTTTAEIPHNTTGSNAEATINVPSGVYSTSSDGLQSNTFGGFSLDVFDRGALFNLGQSLRLKMTVPTNTLFAPAAGKDGIYWNSNFTNTAGTNPDNTGHDSVVNFLPWETPPTPYQVGQTNGSQDYPDIAPGNITQTLQPVTVPASGNAPAVSNAPGDLTSNNITLTQGRIGSGANTVKSRLVYGNPISIQIAVPNHQPANQQLYQEVQGQSSQTQLYSTLGQIAPVTEAGANQITGSDYVFPMGYVTSKRLYVPNANGFYSAQRPYRDVRIYTGVPVDMRTSIAAGSATTDIGKAPAAFGVQTENDPTYDLFTPYGSLASGAYQQSPFQTFFKPLEIHNDGNVNLLNVHLTQKMNVAGMPPTLPLYSDANDPLSFLQGYDITGVTGPRTADLPQTSTPIVEQPFLIRSSVDTDLIAAYGHNPYLAGNAAYPGATFHKPVVGSDQPSTLMVPDAPDRFVSGASPGSAGFLVSPSGFPVMPNGGVTYQAPPYVSLAFPFGTPVGTYHTAVPQDTASLRVFEGLDTAAASAYNPNPATLNYLYPPKYGTAVGGIGQPAYTAATGEVTDSSGTPEDIYNGLQPLSTTGTQLIGTVVEQRLTDGATYGAVPMIDAGPAGTNAQGSANGLSYPDFAPAAFRDPASGDLSVYWTSGRSNNSFGIFGANLPFTLPSAAASAGYFLPSVAPTAANPTGEWWNPFSPAVQTGAVNSGLSITTNSINPSVPGGPIYAFDVGVSTSAGPYSSTLYSYTVNPTNGTLTALGAVTPSASSTQVKYGVHGLYTGANFSNTPNAPSLWAFWTASTRGRTAIYYNSLGSNGTWIPTAPAASTVSLLPVPAGLTAVSDVSPLLMPDAPVNGVYGSVMEATYSGTAPDGSIDLYTSRYLPDTKTPSQLDLVAFPQVTENLKGVAGGWYQARDVAWSRTGALNVSVTVNGTPKPLLYQGATPLFTNAIYDKSSGLLVLTHVTVPGAPANVFYTVYVDAPTGRIRFSPALLPTQNLTPIQATFSPQARRLTTDSRANTASVTFMDTVPKTNDDPNRTAVEADRRWVIWRKAGIAGTTGSATLYFKTQRLTLCLPYPINVTSTPSSATVTNTVNLTSVTLNGVDVTSQVDVDYAQGRIYFPLFLNAEGQMAAATYIEAGTVTATNTSGTSQSVSDEVQWQDEPLINNNDALPATTAAGLNTVIDNAVPIDNAANENNVAAFLDPFAGATASHKVWLFWNSTRNGTADIYSETIDPRFAPGP